MGRLLKSLRTIFPYLLALGVAFIASLLWFQFGTRHFSVWQIMFSDTPAMRNLLPYARWTMLGEIGLLILNPGFFSGILIGVVCVQDWKDVWKGIIPVALLLLVQYVPLLYFFQLYYYIPIYLIPAVFGTLIGRAIKILYGRRLVANQQKSV